jgi:Na+/proline symporter
LVVNTYKVTLVAAFVPLCAGLFWKQATTQGALWAIVAGLTAWFGAEVLAADQAVVPPQLTGLFAATLGMIAGSFLSARRPFRQG